jgi:hypothetical protein
MIFFSHTLAPDNKPRSFSNGVFNSCTFVVCAKQEAQKCSDTSWYSSDWAYTT